MLMKTIGLIGGMSWESTSLYYKIINEVIKEKLGGLHSAKILLYSVDFYDIEKYQMSGDWEKSANTLANVAKCLEDAGADYIVLCTNTMHKVSQQIQENIHIPFLHIADATIEELQYKNVHKVLLLGTKYTMTQDFYKEKLISAGIQVIVPDETEIDTVNSIIYKELCLGQINKKSRNKYLSIITKYAGSGAEGVILGCTEIGLLVGQANSSLPVFDTTEIHAKKAALLSICE